MGTYQVSTVSSLLTAPLTQAYLTGYSPLNRTLAVGSGGTWRTSWPIPSPMWAHRERRRPTDTRPAVLTAAGCQGVVRVSSAHDHRPQAAGHHVHAHLDRLLHGRRFDGAADALGAQRVRFTVLVQRAVQPTVHHARHDHVAAVCNPDRVR